MLPEYTRYQHGNTYKALYNLLLAASERFRAGEACLVMPDDNVASVVISSTGEDQPAGRTLISAEEAVSVPLLLEGRSLGRMVLREPRQPYDPDQLAPFVQTAVHIIAQADAIDDAAAIVEESRVLRDLGLQLGEQPELQGLMQSVARNARRLLHADYASVAILTASGTAKWIAIDGNRSDLYQKIAFEPGKGAAGRVLAARHTITLEGIGQSVNLPADEFPINTSEGGVSVLGAPLMRAGMPFGALIIGSRHPRHWKPEEIELASVLANSGAVVSAQARSAAEERSQRAFLEKVVENFPGVLVVMGPPPEYRVKYINSRTAQLLPEPFKIGPSAVGLPISALGTGRGGGNTLALLDLMTNVYETGETVSFEQYRADDPNGGVKYWNWAIAPIGEKEDDEGRSLILLAHDITEIIEARHQAQEAAQVARSRAEEFEAVIQQMADGVAICDNTGTPIRINPAGEQMLGRGAVAPDELAPDRISEFYEVYSPGGDLFDSAQLPAARAARGEIVMGEQLVIRKPGGQETIISVSAAPLYNNEGEITGSVAVFHDITQEKMVERLKDEFLSVVSHELRTPLSAIMGYSDLILRGVHGALTDRQARALKAVRANANRLLHLINDLLDASKLDSGAVPVVLEPTDLGAVVTKTITQTHVLAMEAELRVQNKVPRELWVLGDEHRLQQVLENLLANAIKFTPPQGTITIESNLSELSADDPAILEPETRLLTDDPAKARTIIISVTDTGVGLEDEQLERIWDRFYQVDGTAKRKVGGTGLGLTIVRGLMQLHGGQVWAESKGRSQGSTFSFAVAVAQPVERVADPSIGATFVRPQREMKPGETRGLVLVAEDDADQREIICDLLELEGFEVALAPDGETAKQLATRLQPKAIALDVLLPRVDGWEVLHYLKNTPETRDIPVLIISVVDHQEFGKKLGAEEYLLKPVDPGLLREKVRRLVG